VPIHLNRACAGKISGWEAFSARCGWPRTRSWGILRLHFRSGGYDELRLSRRRRLRPIFGRCPLYPQ